MSTCHRVENSRRDRTTPPSSCVACPARGAGMGHSSTTPRAVVIFPINHDRAYLLGPYFSCLPMATRCSPADVDGPSKPRAMGRRRRALLRASSDLWVERRRIGPFLAMAETPCAVRTRQSMQAVRPFTTLFSTLFLSNLSQRPSGPQSDAFKRTVAKGLVAVL